APSDDGWEPDPVEDVDPEFDDDLDDSEDDPAFAYVLAFRITDQEGDDVNAYPCHGEEQDGETIEADDDEGVDDNDDDVVFVPEDGDDRECANFDGVDDLWVEGSFLYEIRDEWIVETDLAGGIDPEVPDSLETCLDLADRTVSDLDLGGETEFFDPEDDVDPLEGDEAAVPVYCVYNVVPAGPAPIMVHAMIDGQDFVQTWDVMTGGFARVTQVTATAEADGTIKATLTDMDGQAISADWQLFDRGSFPAEGGDPLTDEDGDFLTGSGSTATFDLSEDDEIEAGEYALYAAWDAGDNTLDYAYARVNLEPAADLDTDADPKRVTAGVPTDFVVMVEGGEDAYEAFFLTHYDFMQVERQGVAYVEDDEYHPGDFDVDEEDRFDFDFGGSESDQEELTLKAEGPYHVYIRNSDETHDNNGSMPVVEVVPPKLVFNPARVPFALEADADVGVTVEDADGHDINGTLRVVFDVDSDYYTSNDYGFAELSGSDVDNDPGDDDEEWGCWEDDDDAEDADGDDYAYTYLEYLDDDDLATEMDVGCAGLTEINVDDGEAELRVTGEDTGPINWTFQHEDEDDVWVNATGALEIVPPGITVQPDRLIAGQGADVVVTISDLGGTPVADMLVSLCGAPIATVTTCTGVSATGADGKAILSVSPTGTGRLEVWIHEPVAEEEEGDCQLEEADFANIDPTTGLFLTAEDADEVDADCDADDDLEFDDTDVFVQVVATQSLLRVTVPDTVSVGAATNIGVTVNNAPKSGATVTVTGPTGAQVFSGATNAAGQASFTPAAEGTYNVRATAAGLQDGTASFRAITGPVDTVSTFTVTEFAISPTSVTVGDTVEAKATITNTGSERGTANVVLLVNGAQRATQGVTLGPGESQSVAFDFTPSIAGTAKLVVKAGTAASQEQTLTVKAKEGGTVGPTPETPKPGVPGFEAILAIAALGAAVVALRRKK
ncbi:MAG TPA: PGF-CTERM sorting domain-containing protein, partial [Candidatus Thermoplasmatota archaeon]|nr:PGF-CTERM sorting domain-containing protein [Candidatus Thermoplasmatota archaeon]